jgi:hypothetical protein
MFQPAGGWFTATDIRPLRERRLAESGGFW